MNDITDTNSRVIAEFVELFYGRREVARAFVHIRSSAPGRPVAAVGDIYRLSAGRIVEHWDILQPLPDESANDHPLF